jgi:ABC-type polysaccharide/polyol phosphate transport system ATPase subunit
MTSVVLENVRVDFPIYGAERSLRKVMFARATGGVIQHEGRKKDRITIRALTDVSMALQDGDRVALVGHNGSGKSTLLKVMAGIYQPIEGRVIVRGRVNPLFDVVPGLDTEDNGYEHLITAGMLVGMSRQQIERKIPEIEEFCELGEYLTLPVRTYSAGMITRLGFALATAVDPEVLLMDEGLGAGDARFAERAARRLENFIGRSRIFVLASHAPDLIKSICNKAVLLEAGGLIAIGSVDEIFSLYAARQEGRTTATTDSAESVTDGAAGPNGGTEDTAKNSTEEPRQEWQKAEFTAEAQ